jgi:hypothetical protein
LWAAMGLRQLSNGVIISNLAGRKYYN